MVSYLLEKGADPTIKDKTGRDALEIAQKLNQNKIKGIFEEVQRIREEEEEQRKLHSKVTLKPFGLREQDFDHSLKTKHSDVPIHKMASLLCKEKLADNSLENYEEV
jgi:hypothetical protein